MTTHLSKLLKYTSTEKQNTKKLVLNVSLEVSTVCVFFFFKCTVIVSMITNMNDNDVTAPSISCG